MEIGDVVEMKGGVSNTDKVLPPPQKFDTRLQFMYWGFTLNNYTPGDGDELKQKLLPICNYFRYQAEEGDKNGVPHLQGVIALFKEKRMRLKQLKDKLHNKAHWYPTNSAAANAYCRKDRTATGDFWQSSETEPDWSQLNKGKPKKKPILTQKITYDMLRDNQKEIADKYSKPCDQFSRMIDWYYEVHGNWGKTFLVKYLIDCCDAIMLSGASKDAINGIFSYISENERVPPIVIFDIPRCAEGHVSYNAIEQIKNGCIFNSKYETGMLRFDTPHIIIFSNEEPVYGKLSRDRWNVVELEHMKTI